MGGVLMLHEKGPEVTHFEGIRVLEKTPDVLDWT
jgi:hypothetical protein